MTSKNDFGLAGMGADSPLPHKTIHGMSLEKFLSIVSNVFFMLVGIVIIAMSSYMLVEIQELTSNASLLETLPLEAIAITFISLGCILFLLSVVGIIGVTTENKDLLAYYLPILFFLVMAQFSFTIVVLIFNSRIEDSIDENVLEEWNDPDNEDAVIELQDYFECCGYKTIDDGVVGVCTWTDPCKQAIIDRINEIWVPITIGIMVVVSLEIIALISTCFAKAKFESSEFEDKFYH